MIDIEEVVVIASPKETGKLRASQCSIFDFTERYANQSDYNAEKCKCFSSEFLYARLWLKITSAVYIRGIGSRINTPAVKLYVDNIPYIDKSAFDFNFYDIERIDILRGLKVHYTDETRWAD